MSLILLVIPKWRCLECSRIFNPKISDNKPYFYCPRCGSDRTVPYRRIGSRYKIDHQLATRNVVD